VAPGWHTAGVPSAPPTRAVIVDVDGVVSPVGDTATPWNDDVVAGHVFGPVTVSPTLCTRLDALAATPGVSCWWLTSWTTQMRQSMHPFPGPHWPVVADGPQAAATDDGWWKLQALESWLNSHPEVASVAWCDDHLRSDHRAAAQRSLAARGVRSLLISPRTNAGLTPAHLRRLEEWAHAPGTR
jgi:hypothetical protein